MEKRRDTSLRSIVVAFAIVVVAFVGASLYIDAQLGDVDDGTRSLAATLPEIERITVLRSDLRELQREVREEIDQLKRGQNGNPDRVERVRGRLDAAQRELAARPHATPLDRELAGTLHAVDDAAGEALTKVRAAKLAEAQHAHADLVRPRVAEADELARTVSARSATQAEHLVDEIEHVRRRSRVASIALDALCILLASAAALVVVRAVKRYRALLEQHNVFVEARATELELFASRVAHDVLSPLSATALAIAHAKRASDDPALGKSLMRGESSLRRVENIVHGLLEFARAGAQPEPGASAPARDVIDGVLDELQPQAIAERIDLAVEPVPDVTVSCARGVLASLLGNLVRNAIKYMGDSETRRITVRARERAGRGARMLRVEVTDTGPGIAADAEGTVFEPYVRGSGASKPGIGLGLATVRKLAVAHGGTVGVASIPGSGATFYFELPIVKDAWTGEPPRLPSAARSSS